MAATTISVLSMSFVSSLLSRSSWGPIAANVVFQSSGWGVTFDLLMSWIRASNAATRWVLLRLQSSVSQSMRCASAHESKARKLTMSWPSKPGASMASASKQGCTSVSERQVLSIVDAVRLGHTPHHCYNNVACTAQAVTCFDRQLCWGFCIVCWCWIKLWHKNPCMMQHMHP